MATGTTTATGATGTGTATAAPAYIQLRRNVVINADLWTATPQILAAGFGFEGITGIPGLLSVANLDLAVAAGAGVNLDYAVLDPAPPLRNLTSAAAPIGYVTAGFDGLPVYADAMPIEFSWPLLPSTVNATDIAITLNTGEVVTPVAAALNPNFDYNERHVIVVFGEFGNRLAPGTPGAVYPVLVTVVADDTPLMAVGPDGPVSIVGLSSPSSSPYVAGPRLVGARLTRMSTVGDFAPPALSIASPNDGVSLYGDAAQYRLRLFTSGGFSPDGVSGFLPTEFERYFRLTATDANGATVVIDRAGVDYDLGPGLGTVRVVGLAELGPKQDGTSVVYGPNYQEDHDNYFDVVLAGDAAAVARLTQVEIPTSAVPGYSDIYNPGGPGRTPTPGVTYTSPAPAQTFAITVSLNDLGTVSHADQAIADYDAADGLPVVFRLYNPATGNHLYTASSNEAAAAVAKGYREEGVPFSAEDGYTGLADVFRLYHAGTDDHVYTINAAERDALIAAGGYRDEGVAFRAYGTATEGAAPVHRFYSDTTNDHFYTTDRAEGEAAGYRYQGVAWYSAAFARRTPEAAPAAGGWVPLEEAFEIIDTGNLRIDPSLALATYKSGGSNPIPESVWRAGYQAPSPYLVNTTRNLQFNESRFLGSPGAPLGTTTYITTADGYTWGAMSEAINAMWPFRVADYAGSTPPITDPYAAGNLVTTPADGVVKVTANYKAQQMKFYAVDPATGRALDRYFVTDTWGNEYIMHASGQTDQSLVRAAFDAAVLPEGWSKSVRQLSADLILDPAEGADGSYHYLVIRDSADNTYHQTGWGSRALQAQVEGMPIWGGGTADVLTGNAAWDNLIHGAGGNDTIVSGAGNDTLWGDAGADRVTAGAGNDVLYGNGGADVLYGNAGNDTLFGGQGNDTLFGGQGDDLLVGGLGTNRLTGGLGRDAFRIVSPGVSVDTITDFTVGEDRIEVVGPNFGSIPLGTLAAGHFALDRPGDGDDWFVFDTATGTLAFDADGSGAGAAVTIATLNVRTLSHADIVVVAG
ncbi:calcium-binding protein [Azospirillum halopraeferens]|uniref:calcium-binding protein n=1 Tax=Azospirillum halopraeferens TaxID=34010 RepID=UPI0004128519|nr:calcium-binding protein [Azospirillum halopraeferens]